MLCPNYRNIMQFTTIQNRETLLCLRGWNLRIFCTLKSKDLTVLTKEMILKITNSFPLDPQIG